MKEYKVTPPIGNITVPKEVMNEKELREFAKEILPQGDVIWTEKIEKDPIELIVDYLRRSSYQVTEILCKTPEKK